MDKKRIMQNKTDIELDKQQQSQAGQPGAGSEQKTEDKKPEEGEFTEKK